MKEQRVITYCIGIIAIMGISFAIVHGITHPGKPLPSYQEKNLEVLKAAQPNDLILCVTGNGPIPTIKRAIIVNQNSGERISGEELDQHTTHYIINDYAYHVFSNCEVRIVKEPLARETILEIILHGLNPSPAR